MGYEDQEEAAHSLMKWLGDVVKIKGITYVPVKELSEVVKPKERACAPVKWSRGVAKMKPEGNPQTAPLKSKPHSCHSRIFDGLFGPIIHL